MAKYTFEIDSAGDIIHGEDMILVLLDLKETLYDVRPDFNFNNDLVEVSDKEIQGEDGIIEVGPKEDDDDIYINGSNEFFCKEQFEEFFPLDTKKLHIKILKDAKQNQESGKRDLSIQE